MQRTGITKKYKSEHFSWRAMRVRCSNPNATGYHNYGGRGIKVCQRWDAFANFLEDMGPKPGLSYSIDRIDVNGDYEPSNTRWATRSQQNSNKRNSSKRNSKKPSDTRLADVHGLANSLDIPVKTLRWRISKGWSFERIVSEPSGANNTRSGVIGVNWLSTKRKWVSRIQVNGNRRAIFTSEDFFEAVCARKSAEANPQAFV